MFLASVLRENSEKGGYRCVELKFNGAQNYSCTCMCIEFLIQVSQQRHAHVFYTVGMVRRCNFQGTHSLAEERPRFSRKSTDLALGGGIMILPEGTMDNGPEFPEALCRKLHVRYAVLERLFKFCLVRICIEACLSPLVRLLECAIIGSAQRAPFQRALVEK